MPKQLSSLKGLRAKEISTVKAGANKKGRFPIFKSEDGMPEEILKAVLEVEVEDEVQLKEIFKKSECSEKGQSAAISILRIVKSFAEEMPQEVVEKLAEMTGIRKEEDMAEYTFPKVSDKEEYQKFLDEMPDEIRKELTPDEVPEKEEEKEEEILKSLPEEAQAILKEQTDKIAALEKSNEATNAVLKQEREDRLLIEWVEKAKTDLSHFPGESADELGKMLMELDGIDSDMATKQFEKMKKASDALKGSSVLKSVGFGGGENEEPSAEGAILKKAAEIIEKSEGMSQEKAYAQAVDENPELYQKYLGEKPIVSAG